MDENRYKKLDQYIAILYESMCSKESMNSSDYVPQTAGSEEPALQKNNIKFIWKTTLSKPWKT